MRFRSLSPREQDRTPAPALILSSVRILVSLLILGLVSVESTSAQVGLFPDEFERADVISIERDGQQLFGFDATTGARTAFRLEVAEEVFFQETRGRVGLVLTNRRALALSPGSGFREIRFQSSETLPAKGLVEDQIALLVTSKRILGFLGGRGRWVEERLSPSESAEALRVGQAVGIVATNRRVLGIGPKLSRFAASDLRVREVIEEVSAKDTLATLRTNKRILVFGSLRGTWAIQDREIR